MSWIVAFDVVDREIEGLIRFPADEAEIELAMDIVIANRQFRRRGDPGDRKLAKTELHFHRFAGDRIEMVVPGMGDPIDIAGVPRHMNVEVIDRDIEAFLGRGGQTGEEFLRVGEFYAPGDDDRRLQGVGDDGLGDEEESAGRRNGEGQEGS